MRQELSWSLGSHVVDIGAEAHWLDNNTAVPDRWRSQPDRGERIERARRRGFARSALGDQPSTRTGAWLQDAWQIGSRAAVQAGLRLDRPGATGEHAAVATRGGDPCFSALAADQGRDRTVYAEPRLREARAKRLPRGSWQRRRSTLAANARCTAHSASSRICRAESRARPRATTNVSLICSSAGSKPRRAPRAPGEV